MTTLEDKISFFDDLADLLGQHNVRIEKDSDTVYFVFDDEISECLCEDITSQSLRERIESLEGYGVS
jgi:hypothetical protein